MIAVILSVTAYWTTPWIVHGLAPGFRGRQFSLTVSMTRIMLPTFLLWLWAGLFSAILQSQDVYAPPAWTTVLMNVVRIASILILGTTMGIRGVAWGFTIGVGSQLLVLIWGLRRAHVIIALRWSMHHPLLGKLARLAGPVILTSLMGTMGLIVDRIFASELPVGTIAALNYSYLIIQLPLGLIAAPLVTPIFTQLSKYIVEERHLRWHSLFWKAIWTMGGLMILVTITIIFAHTWIIQQIYQHGAFNQHSTVLTSGILPYFAAGLVPMALSQLILKALMSVQYTASLPGWTLVATGVNIVADVLLVHTLQGRGLALGTSLASLVYMVGLIYSLAKTSARIASS